MSTAPLPPQPVSPERPLQNVEDVASPAAPSSALPKQPMPWSLVALFSVIAFFAGGLGIDKARALANTLPDLRAQADVSCPSTTTPGTIAPANAKSICVQNTSATCIRLGNIDGATGEPTTATGISIGDGCPAGKVFCADVTQMGCIAESGTGSVSVSFGAP